MRQVEVMEGNAEKKDREREMRMLLNELTKNGKPYD
jgi:hypothetical protein